MAWVVLLGAGRTAVRRMFVVLKMMAVTAERAVPAKSQPKPRSGDTVI